MQSSRDPVDQTASDGKRQAESGKSGFIYLRAAKFQKYTILKLLWQGILAVGGQEQITGPLGEYSAKNIQLTNLLTMGNRVLLYDSILPPCIGAAGDIGEAECAIRV